jgi:NAD(P)-dependent dehydrogenase (short-subunit alcohol dehydrogenase family)
MDLQLKGKLAIVTGSTAGIGLAAATALAREGARVVVNGRTQQRIDAAIAEIRKQLGVAAEVSGVAADLATADGCKRLIAQVPSAEILVNNMGIFEPKAFSAITDADWLRFFEANVLSGVRLSRHYLPGMIQANWGRIVFVSSESAVQIPAEMIHYGMTKTAQIAIARGLAETTSGTGVTVNSVLPGPTNSEGVATFVGDLARQRGVSLGEMEKDFFKTARPSSLLQRFITSEEVANLIAYVCSSASAATNGSALRVDGGVVRSAF